MDDKNYGKYRNMSMIKLLSFIVNVKYELFFIFTNRGKMTINMN